MAVSIIAFFSTFLVLTVFAIIVAVLKWKVTSGKIFTVHLLTKIIWFLGIFLTSFSSYNIVFTGAVLFVIGGWGLGYTMLLFFMLIYKGEEYFKKFLKYTFLFSVIYFLTFFVFKPFVLTPSGEGYYFKLTNYFFIPALLLSLSYYLVIILFYYISTVKKGAEHNYYFLFALGLLIHAIPAHTLVILEFVFGYPCMITNMEYTSLIGFSIALYAFMFVNTRNTGK